jgi:hypothetical protein
MAQVKIFLAPHVVSREMPFGKNIEFVRNNLDSYTLAGTFNWRQTGAEAAEEAFDLTNNPYRQDERVQQYGRGRSVSVGDVIEVDGVKHVCMSCSWETL